MKSLAGAGLNAEFGEEVKTALDAAKEAVEQERQETAGDDDIQEEPRPTESVRSNYELLQELAELSPEAAITNAWKMVETKLRSTLDGLKPSSPDNRRRSSNLDVINKLRALGLNDLVVVSIDSLRHLRNEAAHTTNPISRRAARDYIDSAMLILGILDRFAEDRRGEPLN
jgi:hypothetical protein